MESKCLDFDNMTPKGRKTYIIKVWNKVTNDYLGEIRWSGGWRQYCFFTNDACALQFSKSCLDDISAFIKELMEKRRKL